MKNFFKRYGRWVSPSAFGIAVICFSMPFMGIKCAEERLVTVSAYDVAVGGVYPKHLEGKTEEVDEKDKDDVKFEPANILMSFALPLLLLAAFCAIWRNKLGLALTLLCGGLAGLLTIAFRILSSLSFAASIKPSEGDIDLSALVRLDWRYGFWCILIFCAAGLITRLYYEGVKG
jgi:hypothetical protein